jgi:uncharacterized protein (DUF302 family)
MPKLDLTVAAPLAEVRSAIEAALKTQGFGILTEIDLQATFQAKLGAAHEAHRILGVCNPQIAKGALDLDRDVALLLPCTVTLREVPGGTEVRVLDPEAAFNLAAPETRARLAPLAADVGDRLSKALAELKLPVREETGPV